MTRNGCKMRVTIVGTHLGESVFIIKEGRIKKILIKMEYEGPEKFISQVLHEFVTLCDCFK